jgi:acyl CoA:acetate/3-ketoacid CoA transferase alpha subunit
LVVAVIIKTNGAAREVFAHAGEIAGIRQWDNGEIQVVIGRQDVLAYRCVVGGVGVKMAATAARDSIVRVVLAQAGPASGGERIVADVLLPAMTADTTQIELNRVSNSKGDGHGDVTLRAAFVTDVAFVTDRILVTVHQVGAPAVAGGQ